MTAPARCVSPAVIARVAAALETAPAAAPALGVTDALWTGTDAKVTGLQPREGLYRAQTPQGFHFPAILNAHRTHPGGAADDVEVALAAGLDVAIVEGEEENIKLTWPGDFARAERMLRGAWISAPAMAMTSTPSDRRRPCHALRGAGAAFEGAAGPFRRRCRHACPDGRNLWRAGGGRYRPTLSALGPSVERRGEPDLPDPRRRCLPVSMGYRIANADVTLVCERPKIGPHAVEMASELARIVGVEPDRCQRQGHHLRTAGLHRPRGRHRRHRHRHPGEAMTFPRLLATWFGTGLLRPAPGTWGSAVALGLGLLLHGIGHFPLLLAATADRHAARLLGNSENSRRADRQGPVRDRHRRGGGTVDRASLPLRRILVDGA